MNGTCGPCLIRHCDPNLSRPDFEERKRERRRKRRRRDARCAKTSGAQIKRYIPIRFSREYLRNCRIENDESYQRYEERPPCNTLKSSFPLHTLENEKCETRVTVRVDSNASVLSIFLRIPLAIYMATVCPFVLQRAPLCLRGSTLISRKLRTESGKRKEEETRGWRVRIFINSRYSRNIF